MASTHGHHEVVRLLLEARADADLADEYGRSPLYVACCKGYPKIVSLLLEARANTDKVSKHYGTSPIAVASSQNRVEEAGFFQDTPFQNQGCGPPLLMIPI